MLILGVLGLVMAVWTWNSVHPVLGLIVGFLFVGGAGWRIVGGLLGGLFGAATPTGRSAYGPEGRRFIVAWEERFGEMRPGAGNAPPPGAFKTWLAENDRTGVGPGGWIDERMGTRPQHVRHFPLEDDGRGVTFYITEKPGRGHEVFWDFDEGLSDEWRSELFLDMLVKRRLSAFEEDLGLPLTFPYAADPKVDEPLEDEPQ